MVADVIPEAELFCRRTAVIAIQFTRVNFEGNVGEGFSTRQARDASEQGVEVAKVKVESGLEPARAAVGGGMIFATVLGVFFPPNLFTLIVRRNNA